MENQFVLTLEKVKNCIGFEPGSPEYISLSGMCDFWFVLEKEKGHTDEEAANVALNNLVRRLRQMGEVIGG